MVGWNTYTGPLHHTSCGTKAHIFPAWRDCTVSYQFSHGKGSLVYTYVWRWVAASSVVFVHFHEKFTNCGKFVFPPSFPPSLFDVEFQEANQECKTIVTHSCSEYFVTALMEKNLSCLENVQLESCSQVEQSNQFLQFD